MQPQLGILKRFIKSLFGWTDAASAGDLEEVYKKLISCGQMQSQLGIRKRFIKSLLGVDRCSFSWGSGTGLLEVYQLSTDAASAVDLEEVD